MKEWLLHYGEDQNDVSHSVSAETDDIHVPHERIINQINYCHEKALPWVLLSKQDTWEVIYSGNGGEKLYYESMISVEA